MEIRDISLLQARSIRREVLRPGRPESEVAYPGDASEFAQHLGAFEGDKLIGVATFLPEPCPEQDRAGAWRLRGMATVRSAQRRGVGGQLLSYGLKCILRQGATFIWCHGRTSARAFYERHGFRASGEEFALPHSGPHYLFILRAG
jgi:GNAT superfamily N-acetyltransferase